MSGEGPESVPTSADPRSRRPLKKRAIDSNTAHAAHISALFARPDQDIRLPPSSTSSALIGGSKRPAPPEIVTNVQGSSAGAGSGEFHVYKAARRREYERLREMDDEVRREKGNEEFERGRTEAERRDEEKTRKNREKRERLKAKKNQKGNGVGGGGSGGKPTASAATALRIKDDPASEDEQVRNGADEQLPRQEPESKQSDLANPVGLIIHDDD